MFFKDYFNSAMDIINFKFEGIQRKGQNPVDKGELCELFIKELLSDLFADQFKIFRGGKIINIDNSESKQIDIVLTSKNTIKIFGDKGIYPIESVFGVFSITANLDHPKMLDCIEEFKSIPKTNPQFDFHMVNEIETLKKWNERVPYKCIFGYKGDINQKWEDELNKTVSDSPLAKHYLPDLIIINQKGIITKLHDGPKEFVGGGSTTVANKHFHYTDFNQYKFHGAAISLMANELYILSNWQNYVLPKYHEYMNRDLSSV